MPDDVVEAACQYALHCQSCDVCSQPGYELCDKGLELMRLFQDALHTFSLKKEVN